MYEGYLLSCHGCTVLVILAIFISNEERS